MIHLMDIIIVIIIGIYFLTEKVQQVQLHS